MQLAERLGPIGERLVVLAREFTDDANETYLIAHKALRTLLRNDASLSNAEPAGLRAAVARAAKTLGIGAPGDRRGLDLSASGAGGPTPPTSASMS